MDTVLKGNWSIDSTFIFCYALRYFVHKLKHVVIRSCK